MQFQFLHNWLFLENPNRPSIAGFINNLFVSLVMVGRLKTNYFEIFFIGVAMCSILAGYKA